VDTGFYGGHAQSFINKTLRNRLATLEEEVHRLTMRLAEAAEENSVLRRQAVSTIGRPVQGDGCHDPSDGGDMAGPPRAPA
jgi:hypothetical protein